MPKSSLNSATRPLAASPPWHASSPNKMLKLIKSQIPNTITCLNLVAGCLACIFAFSATETFGSLLGYQWVFILLGIGAIFDFCDGAAARLLDAYSPLGKELDSLSDLISFGLAPALLLYNTIEHFSSCSFMPYLAIAIAVGGALRLAKFNIDENQATTFKGLPIPANAIFWIGACNWIYTNQYPGDIAMAVIILAITFLMVSNLKMTSLKFKNFDWRENFRRYVLIFAAISFVAIWGISGFAWTICFYTLISVFARKGNE